MKKNLRPRMPWFRRPSRKKDIPHHHDDMFYTLLNWRWPWSNQIPFNVSEPVTFQDAVQIDIDYMQPDDISLVLHIRNFLMSVGPLGGTIYYWNSSHDKT